MEITTKIPITLAERLEFGEELRLSASWEEFLHYVAITEHRIEYDEGQIISFMGYASVEHEQLIMNLGYLFRSLLGSENYRLFASNLALQIPGFGKNYFNADLTVVKGELEKAKLSENMTALLNPILLVEILSPSTLNHDLGNKFHKYRKIPSLEQVLFIDSQSVHVVSHTRVGRSEDWLLKEWTSRENHFPILKEGEININELYQGIKFE